MTSKILHYASYFQLSFHCLEMWSFMFDILLSVLYFSCKLHSFNACKIVWWFSTKKERSKKFRSTLKDCHNVAYTYRTSWQFRCANPIRPHWLDSMCWSYTYSFIFSLFCRLRSSRILPRKRKRILKHFSNSSLLQKLVTFVRNYSIYQPITDFTEGCLGQSVWVQKSKDCCIQQCLFQCVS